MNNIKLILSLILLLNISACQSKNKPQINEFTVSAKIAEPNEQVNFSWLVSGNGALPCQLDAYGDSSDNYSITDCRSSTSQQHIYTATGHHVARLLAGNKRNSSISANAAITIMRPSSVTIAAVGDISCDPLSGSFNSAKGTAKHCRMQAIADQIEAIDPIAFLPLGDIQYENGEFWKFVESYDYVFGKFKEITYPAAGNHEYITPDAAGYFNYFGKIAGSPSKGYYSYEIGKWHMISLNSNCWELSRIDGCGVDSEQTEWLRKDLARHSNDCILAYWHHPRFSSGRHGNDLAYAAFWDTLYKAKADIILVGHDHIYERFAPMKSTGALDRSRGIRQFIFGTGGKNLTKITAIKNHSEVRNDENYGFLRLGLHRQTYDWQFISDKGVILDSGSDKCHF